MLHGFIQMSVIIIRMTQDLHGLNLYVVLSFDFILCRSFVDIFGNLIKNYFKHSI